MSNSKEKQKRAPILCAAVIIAVLGVFLGTFLLPLIGEMAGMVFAMGVLVIYAAGVVAVIVGVIAALRQRLREIESGEEEEAKKY